MFVDFGAQITCYGGDTACVTVQSATCTRKKHVGDRLVSAERCSDLLLFVRGTMFRLVFLGCVKPFQVPGGQGSRGERGHAGWRFGLGPGQEVQEDRDGTVPCSKGTIDFLPLSLGSGFDECGLVPLRLTMRSTFVSSGFFSYKSLGRTRSEGNRETNSLCVLLGRKSRFDRSTREGKKDTR